MHPSVSGRNADILEAGKQIAYTGALDLRVTEKVRITLWELNI